MARVEKTIEVNVPVRTAYDQWTQFEEFPNFMEGVEQVTQLDDKRLHWRAKVAGKEEEWEAVIREQVPDQKIIWRNTTGAENAGMVTFDNLGATKTRVHLEMSYDPEGFVENMGDKLGFFSRRVEGDLKRFKEFIESRGSQTGGWRGEIKNPDVSGGHTLGDTSAMPSDKGSGQHANMEGSEPKPSGWALGDDESGAGKGMASSDAPRMGSTDRSDPSGSTSSDMGGRSGYSPKSDPTGTTEMRGTLGASGYGEGSERPLGSGHTSPPLGVTDPQGNYGRGAGNAPANRQRSSLDDAVGIDSDADPDLDRGRPDAERRDLH
jgi:hypothetical protein